MDHQDDNLKGSLIASTILHVGGLLFIIFGLPSLSNPPPLMPWRPVPVDIVEIGAITNTRLRSDADKQTARTSPKEKPAAPKEPEVEKVKLPPPPKPSSKPETPAPEEEALPSPKQKPAPPKAKPEPKPKPVPKEEPQQEVDPLASVLKNVARLKPAPAPLSDAREDEKRNDGEALDGEAKGFGPALADRLTISQEDMLRRQISGCWNMPVGARNAEDLIVEVLIEVNEDRTVRSAEVVDQSRMGRDTYFRAAAEAALRALRHPKCSPLMLPEGQYEQWKTIRFNFDPRDML